MKKHTENGQTQTATEDRLAALERMLAAQQERLAQQEAEITRLHAALTTQDEAAPAGENTAPHQGAERNPLLRPATRRTLLRLGGAAAAGGVAAVGAQALLAPVARAAGTAWQTGPVSADAETLVKPSGSGYADADILQLQLGTGSVYRPLGSQTNAAKAALTAYDTTTNNIGVYASSQTGFGLFGVTDSGNGATGAGLNGTANSSGTGVLGTSQSGTGVLGTSISGLGASFAGGQAPLQLAPAAQPGPPSTGVHVVGEVYVDSNGTIWICQVGGDFSSTSGKPAFSPLSGIVFLPAPVRVIGGTVIGGGLPGQPLSAQQTYSFGLDAYVPSFAKGFFGNATIHTLSNAGHLDLWPAGSAHPAPSTVNYQPSDIPLSNFCIVGLGSGTDSFSHNAFNRGFSAWSYAGGKFIFDLAGYIV